MSEEEMAMHAMSVFYSSRTAWHGALSIALAQLWSRYGSENTIREDTAGLVRIVILYLHVDKRYYPYLK
jgi:hypothetical protein